MSLAAVGAEILATAAAVGLVLPAVRRTGLGLWHPAALWLAFELVFFGVGSAILAIGEGRTEVALDVGAALLLFGLGVWASDRLARRRTDPAMPTTDRTLDDVRVRGWVVGGLAGLGVLALVPTLLDVGIPFLAGDITGARVEVGGIDLQLLRVTLPAAVAVAALIASRNAARRTRLIALGVAVLAVVAELALASRYLAAELAAVVILAIGIARRPIRIEWLAAIGVAGAVLFISVGILRAYDKAAGRELAFAIDRSVNRVLLIQPRTLDALQVTIPDQQPFFGGRTWIRRLATALGQAEAPNLGYWIYPRLFPDQVTPGYAAPGLLGEAWANFGWAGLSLFALVGVLAERLGALLARRRAVLADVVAGALLALFLARTHALGLNGLAILVVIVGAWRLLAARLGDLGRDLRLAATWRA